MLLDHVIMYFVLLVLALPVISLDYMDAFWENPSDAKVTFDLGMILMISGVSLYLNKDIIIQGKSIAKRISKQEVVDIKTGRVATSLICPIRNIIIVLWLIGVIVVLINPSRRLGDLFAGTKVEYL